MKAIKQTDKHHVYSAWLKSETYRMNDLTPEEIALINNPDLNNEQQNSAREELLFNRFGRVAILEKIPSDLDWFEGELEEGDIDNLYMLPVFDWFMDTGRTFQLKNVINHLSPNRAHLIYNGQLTPVVHHKMIGEMDKALDDKIQDIVLVTSGNNDAPFTIIDGTHRSSLLMRRGTIVGTKVFFGKGDMTNCFWSVERNDFQNHVAELNRLTLQGAMW